MIDRLFSQFDPRIFGIQDASQRPCIFETTPKYKSNHNTQKKKKENTAMSQWEIEWCGTAIGDWFQSGVGAPIIDEFTTKAMQSWITFDTKWKIF